MEIFRRAHNIGNLLKVHMKLLFRKEKILWSEEAGNPVIGGVPVICKKKASRKDGNVQKKASPNDVSRRDAEAQRKNLPSP